MGAAPGPVLVLGATSAIARGACAELARRGHRLILAGRNREALENNAADLRCRYGVQAEVEVFDADVTGEHERFIAGIDERIGLEGVFFAVGYLGDVEGAATSFAEADAIIARNFTAAVSLLTACANALAARERGFIIAVSSVAADRGRQSNYVYGASKAGLDAFLSGLRNRLFHRGVRVITIRPGFVDTPMTFGKPGMPMVADPDVVGRQAIEALDGGADVVYLPWFWRPIMQVIKLIPERVFKRLRL